MTIKTMKMEVHSEKFIAENADMVVVMRVEDSPQPAVPSSTKIFCSGCHVECWIAPSGRAILDKDTTGHLPTFCLQCAMAYMTAAPS